MIYIILSQDKRNINEILYDHNTENIHATICEDQKTYRRDEIKMKKAFICILIAIVVLYIGATIDLLTTNAEYTWIIISGIYASQSISLLVAFVILFYLMNKKHHYEFIKSRNHMLSYFGFTILITTLSAIYQYSLIEAKDMLYLFVNVEELWKLCSGSTKISYNWFTLTIIDYGRFFFILREMTGTIDLLSAIIIIKVKSSVDCL